MATTHNTAEKQPAQFTNSLHRMEDTLVDLRALIRIGLALTENVDQETLGRMISEMNTLFYLLQDKVEACAKTNTAMFRADYSIAIGERLQ